ncbi:MAG: hypothetical protein A2655_02075 [Candidatus Yanofskybacteria bacterium RIFCSPHIGHO2_01_FULL_43_42]|uniref:Glycosyl transferase family 1 domain-containing protein n=1 Tax=Candidatus Yanofskybacteria bacterium RIFCSPLOWO2_01_FULL_43_22 TaxID=1802695 RepID=A0A1F8GH01_9BACT|nr:MAG: hypothetical protein A2655_02075 [Candidatus Yanofskybacteria bacterium RIFCSPHIGHO2_01_FULL_43_42]OGN13256.1 MAG: hypothetical protein A3D48_02980 [Candidatus Yanofskybacteria bacterium RIFCSPHIGHO2_02_FULL_43_17]OGN24672.1 MAG: hypothetical protein A3A13_01205 [Candidatus Yanofskybacteria bacterium RIFCSPLOWO2_01_FULL_43_22]
MPHKINHSESTQESLKKRILFVITQSEFGGAQRFLHTLVTRLDRTKYEILVAAGPSFGSKYDLLDLLEKEEIKTLRLKYLKREISPLSDIRASFELRKASKKFKPDTLFLLSSKAGFIGSFVSKCLIRNTEYKILYRIGGWTFNDPWPKWKKLLWIIIERISAKWKDLIIVNNKHDFEQANKFKIRPKEKTVIIYNGLDVYKTGILPKEDAQLKLYEKAIQQSGRVFQDRIIIGTIANFYPTKGLGYLIETAEYFKNKDNIVFMVIGDGPERASLENLIKQKGLQKKIIFLGQIPDAHKLLSAFDIFVLPSIKEGFPWVVIEAMAAKLPVVATRVGAVPEIIEDGKNGFIVEPARPEQIASKIQDLLNDERLRQELGIQAHQTVLFKFSLDKMVREIEDLL